MSVMWEKLRQPIKDNSRGNIFYLTYSSLCSGSRWKIEGKIFYHNLHLMLLFWMMQLLHACATNLAYFRHVQSEPLHDLGFDTIPSLHPELRHVSEILCFTIIIAVFMASFLVFFLNPTPIYWSTLIIRVKFALALCTFFRIITFLSTGLPGPAPHCQPNSDEYNPPDDIHEVLFRVEIFKGCGDLIFSSHTALTMTFVLAAYTYLHLLINRTSYRILVFGFYWPLLITNVCFIIAARKHYTVDVVVALYTTPLLWNLSFTLVSDQKMIKNVVINQMEIISQNTNSSKSNLISITTRTGSTSSLL